MFRQRVEPVVRARTRRVANQWVVVVEVGPGTVVRRAKAVVLRYRPPRPFGVRLVGRVDVEWQEEEEVWAWPFRLESSAWIPWWPKHCHQQPARFAVFPLAPVEDLQLREVPRVLPEEEPVREDPTTTKLREVPPVPFSCPRLPGAEDARAPAEAHWPRRQEVPPQGLRQRPRSSFPSWHARLRVHGLVPPEHDYHRFVHPGLCPVHGLDRVRRLGRVPVECVSFFPFSY